MDCPERTRAQDNFSRCGADVCPIRASVQRDGTCLLCPDYARPTKARTDCEWPRCTTGLYATTEAECVATCPPGQIPTGRRCTFNGRITAASEGLSRDELELEGPEVHAAELHDHDHAVVGAARKGVDFLDEREAGEFFRQEK